MGIVHARRGANLVPAIILMVLVALVVVALTAGPAAAFSSYKHGPAQSCADCHKVDTNTPPTNADCTACHTGGFVAHPKAGAATTCWTCHTPGQSMTTIQTAAGCGSTAAGAGCHAGPGHIGSTPTNCTTCHTPSTGAAAPGQSAHHKTSVTDVTVKALLTIKSSAASITYGKTVKVSGLAKSVQSGYVVKVLVQKKSSTGKWANVTTKTAAWTQATSAWTLTYKPTKGKGAYRFQASTPTVVGTNGNAVAISAKKSAYKNLTVK